jgi:hypothetical protein
MLRLTDPSNSPAQLHQRRDALERLTGEPLPTAAEEQRHPLRSDQHYTCATRTLIARVRQHESRHPLVKIELINYGFGRNLLALEPIAVALLVVLLLLDGLAVVLGADVKMIITTAVIDSLLLLGWSTIVRPDCVLRQGNNYAERLLEALLDPQLDQNPTS